MSERPPHSMSPDALQVTLEGIQRELRMLKILVFSVYGALALAAFKVLENIIVEGTL